MVTFTAKIEDWNFWLSGVPNLVIESWKWPKNRKNSKQTLSLWPGDLFSYPKCYHSSKTHRNISDDILGPKGGGGVWSLPTRLENDPHLSFWNHIYEFTIKISSITITVIIIIIITIIVPIIIVSSIIITITVYIIISWKRMRSVFTENWSIFPRKTIWFCYYIPFYWSYRVQIKIYMEC